LHRSQLAAAPLPPVSRGDKGISMSANIEYQLHKLAGTIDGLGPALPARRDPAIKSGTVFHRHIRMRIAEGQAELINVYVPAAIDSWLKPGLVCDLYVVEAEAKVCPSVLGGCTADGPICHVFAIDTGKKCLSALSEAAGYFGALKRFGVDMLASWAGLALLVSFIVIGIPFLVYFGALTLLAMAVPVPSVGELRRFLGRQGFPTRCGGTA
jgi:hypothetical protein